MIHRYGTFLSEEERDRNQDWGYFEDEYSSTVDYLKKVLTKEFGEENSYSGSADWGGIPVWSVKGDKFIGTFVGIDDNQEVFLMSRKTKGKDHDEYADTNIASASNQKELLDLIKKAKTIKGGQPVHESMIKSGEDKEYAKTVIGIIRRELKAGTDKGSSQAVIDTKDFAKVAEEIVLYFKPLLKK